MKKDNSTKMSPGKRRSKAGSNATAGNSVKSGNQSQSGNEVTAVSKQSKRFGETRTRRG